jgi:hypothetical protein
MPDQIDDNWHRQGAVRHTSAISIRRPKDLGYDTNLDFASLAIAAVVISCVKRRRGRDMHLPTASP